MTEGEALRDEGPRQHPGLRESSSMPALRVGDRGDAAGGQGPGGGCYRFGTLARPNPEPPPPDEGVNPPPQMKGQTAIYLDRTFGHQR